MPKKTVISVEQTIEMATWALKGEFTKEQVAKVLDTYSRTIVYISNKFRPKSIGDELNILTPFASIHFLNVGENLIRNEKGLIKEQLMDSINIQVAGPKAYLWAANHNQALQIYKDGLKMPEPIKFTAEELMASINEQFNPMSKLDVESWGLPIDGLTFSEVTSKK